MPVIIRRWWMERWKRENEDIEKKRGRQNPKKGA
jgi:hypothetical protein